MHYFQKRLTFLFLCGVILLSGMYFQATQISMEEAMQASADYKEVTAGAKRIPTLELKGMDGETYALNQLDKPLFLTFFASWCEVCKEELPKLSAMYAQNEDKLHMIAVNATSKEYRKEDVHSFVREAKLSMPVLLDEEGEAIEAFHVSMVPFSFLIDSEGFIKKTFYGPVSGEEINKELRSLPSS